MAKAKKQKSKSSDTGESRGLWVHPNITAMMKGSGGNRAFSDSTEAYRKAYFQSLTQSPASREGVPFRKEDLQRFALDDNHQRRVSSSTRSGAATKPALKKQKQKQGSPVSETSIRPELVERVPRPRPKPGQLVVPKPPKLTLPKPPRGPSPPKLNTSKPPRGSR